MMLAQLTPPPRTSVSQMDEILIQALQRSGLSPPPPPLFLPQLNTGREWAWNFSRHATGRGEGNTPDRSPVHHTVTQHTSTPRGNACFWTVEETRMNIEIYEQIQTQQDVHDVTQEEYRLVDDKTADT